jgi:membrane protein implicated in regulation of membrane protease activity
MFVYLYLFALIVGGVLLGASILLGGDHDADADADADVDADVDADAGVDAHGDLDHSHGTMDMGGHGPAGALLAALRSFRFWTFFLAFFGLTGLVLTWLGLVDSDLLALALSGGMGAVSGLGVFGVLRHLSSDDSGSVASSNDYVGKTAKVVVPVSPGGVGKVRLQLRGTTVDVLATSIEEESVGAREEVLIVEMDGTRAKVARVDTK